MSVTKIKCIDSNAYLAAAHTQAQEMQKEASIDLAIQVAMYMVERKIFGQVTDLKKKLADRRLTMARQVVDHINHARPTEGAFVDEVMSASKPAPTYTGATSATADANGVQARRRIDAELARIGAESQSACFDNRTLRGLALAGIDLTAYAMRTEEARANKLSERRVSRQLSVVAMGKGLVADALRIGMIGSNTNAVVAGTIVESLNAASAVFSYANHRWRKPEGWDPTKAEPPRIVKPGEVMIETKDPRTGNLAHNVVSFEAARAYHLSNQATQGIGQQEVDAVTPFYDDEPLNLKPDPGLRIGGL